MITRKIFISVGRYTSGTSSDGCEGKPIEQTFGRKHSTSEDHESSYLASFYLVSYQFCLSHPCIHTLSMFSSSSWVAPVAWVAPVILLLLEDRSLWTI